jgi:predicted AlkP superfamily pyrophosphatase or phosphodiesterase
MSQPLLRLFAVVALIVGLPFSPRPSAQAPRASASNHVVLISLDGFPASALMDPAVPLPTLRRLARDGAVAKAMRPVNPTVTWANHTSMITGVTPAKHGVIYNGLLVREPGVAPKVEPWRDKKDMVRVPTLYDIAHERGLTSAQVDWVAIWNAPTVTWEFRERPDPKSTIAQELVTAGVLSQAELEDFGPKNIVYKDRVWTEATMHIIRRHKPNLMMFHLLTLDTMQHRYGPGTLAAHAVMAHLDSQVASIVQAVEQAGLSARTTFIIVSDHGFKAVKRQINPNVALVNAGLIEVTDNKPTSVSAWVMPEGGTALAYVTAPDEDGRIRARLKETLTGIDGIDRIVEPAEYAAFDLPVPTDSNQMGEFFLTAKNGYAFTAALGAQLVNDAPEGSLGSHGYLNTDPDLRAIFIASGRGITRGTAIDSVDTIDVAPTIARLLGLPLPNADGRALTEILVKR